MPDKNLYIQHTPGRPMMEHCQAIWQGALFREYGIQFFDPVDMPRIPIDPNIILVGSVETTNNWLRELKGFMPPAPLNIPPALVPYVGRTLGQTTLGEYLNGNGPVLFIKPLAEHKLFTGGVYKRDKNYFKLLAKELPSETPVLTSTLVDFASEYRIFVNRNEGIRGSGFVGMRHYSGNPFVVPDSDVIQAMLEAYRPTAPRCYSLDVGVVQYDNTNREDTFLVECNDFFALGTYGFDALAYTDMTILRWAEIINQLKPLTLS